MPDPLTIWSNVELPPGPAARLQERLPPHRLVQAAATSADNLAPAEQDPQLAAAEVAFGQPDPDQVARLPKLRYVQLTTAGYTRYDTDAFRDAVKRNGTIVCNASSIYDEPCAQHALAMMLSHARRLPQSQDNQRGERGWPYLPLRAETKLLNGQTVLLVGYGAIARQLAAYLGPFGMNVIGFRRTPRDEPGVKVVRIDDLDDWLPRADHVVNVLPASTDTEGFFHAERLGRMTPGTVYYNIGRGSTNDQAALVAALNDGRLAAAYIDATAPEPLPPDHPLWTARNCVVTPHTAGGHTQEYDRHVDQLLGNLQRLQAGEPLVDRIM